MTRVGGDWSLPQLARMDIVVPETLEDLLNEVSQGRRPYRGGTDLLVRAAHTGGVVPPLAHTGRVPELCQISDGGTLRVGGAVTLRQLCRNPVVRRSAPALFDSASIVGSVQVRTMASLAGNLCNASPSADTVPALIAHGATVEIRGATGTRTVPAGSFCTGPGTTVLREGEVVTAIEIPSLGNDEGSAYRRFTERASMDLAFVGVAIWVALGDEGQVRAARVALGAVGPTVLLVEEAGARLVGSHGGDEDLRAAGEAAAGAARPIDDLRASVAYRRHLVRVLTLDVARQALTRARQREAA